MPSRAEYDIVMLPLNTSLILTVGWLFAVAQANANRVWH